MGRRRKRNKRAWRMAKQFYTSQNKINKKIIYKEGTPDELIELMLNANIQLKQDASITGITPIASLSVPAIRKLWPKFALKDSLIDPREEFIQELKEENPNITKEELDLALAYYDAGLI